MASKGEEKTPQLQPAISRVSEYKYRFFEGSTRSKDQTERVKKKENGALRMPEFVFIYLFIYLCIHLFIYLFGIDPTLFTE